MKAVNVDKTKKVGDLSKNYPKKGILVYYTCLHYKQNLLYYSKQAPSK